MILSLKIALKFYQGPRNSILVSLVSLVSVISIAIGITVAIIALNTMNGFKYELSNRILAVIPHGEVKSINMSFVNWKNICARIRQIPNIIHVSPYINFSGVIEYNNKWHVVYIRSVDLTQSTGANKLINFIEKNFWKYFSENTEQIILGKGIANNLGIKVSDWITVLIHHNFCSTNKLFAYKKIRLQVAGILDLNSQLDCNIAIISLSDAQRYYDNVSDIEGIAITVNDVFSINRIKYKIEKIFNNQFYVQSWIDSYGYIYKDIQMIRVVIYLSMILIIGISCFNVIATLILSIKDKNYDIAIICALGAQNVLIQRIFFWYGFIIYIFASIVGTGLGVFISCNLTNFIAICNDVLGIKIMSKDIYFINFLPIKLSSWDILLVLILTLLLGLLTSWYVSLKTRNIKLSQILK